MCAETRKNQYEQIGVAMTCRNFAEYERMFDLEAAELGRGAILDIAGGASSFTAQANEKGFSAFAVDPRYRGDRDVWIREAAEEISVSTAKLDKLKERFDWSYYGSLSAHEAGRKASLNQFAAHLRSDSAARIYREGSLPDLPFAANSFSLVLCSHFLFLYAQQFGGAFHERAVGDMMRVCKPGGEIKIYPLVTLAWEPYEALDERMETIRARGGEPRLRASRLPFIPGSNYFLNIQMM